MFKDIKTILYVESGRSHRGYVFFIIMETNQNAVMVFSNPEFGKIRTVVDEKGEPLFCLVDLCKALELENPTMVKARLREDGLNSTEVIDAIGRKQIATFVNERNMYRCIL